MKKNHAIINILGLFIFGLSACAVPEKAEKPEVNTEITVTESVETLEPSTTDSTEMGLPAWFSQELKDVNTGMVFKISDFKEKVILVETLAVWCPKCLSQQKEIAKLKSQLADREDFVSIGIDIDPNENESLLSSHVKKNGFDWVFAIASKTVIDEIGSLYGAQYLNPTATPMLIIDRQGTQHLLPFGIKSAEELQKAIQPFLDAD